MRSHLVSNSEFFLLFPNSELGKGRVRQKAGSSQPGKVPSVPDQKSGEKCTKEAPRILKTWERHWLLSPACQKAFHALGVL